MFDPVSVRRTAFHYALRSEASLRFEKGQEVRLARIGADRTAQLVAAWAGGEVAPGRVDTNPVEPEPARWRSARPGSTGSSAWTSRRTSSASSSSAWGSQRSRLRRHSHPGRHRPTAARAVAGEGEALLAVVPTWRRDLHIEADVAEEVARVRGYEVIPGILPHTPMPPYRPSPLEVRDAIRERSRAPASARS